MATIKTRGRKATLAVTTPLADKSKPDMSIILNTMLIGSLERMEERTQAGYIP